LPALAKATIGGQRRVPGVRLYDDRVIRLLETLLLVLPLPLTGQRVSCVLAFWLAIGSPTLITTSASFTTTSPSCQRPGATRRPHAPLSPHGSTWIDRVAQSSHMHGGKSPQALTAARERIAAMVDPTLVALRRLVDQADSGAVQLSAIKDIFDRAGYKPVDRADVTIRGTGVHIYLPARAEGAQYGAAEPADVPHRR
jgi:hypothetical protein